MTAAFGGLTPPDPRGFFQPPVPDPREMYTQVGLPSWKQTLSLALGWTLAQVLRTVHKTDVGEPLLGLRSPQHFSRTRFLIIFVLAAAQPPWWPLGGSVEHIPICTFQWELHSRNPEGPSTCHQTEQLTNLSELPF